MRDHGGEGLSAFIDGTLDPRGVAEIEAHLHACSQCRDEADGLRATLRDLRSFERPVLAETDRARLHLELAKARRSRSGVWPKISAVAAAVVLIAGGGVALTRSGSDTGAGGLALRSTEPAQVQDVDYGEDSARELLTAGPQLEAYAAESGLTGARRDAGSQKADDSAPEVAAAEEPFPAIDHVARIADCEATFLGDNNVTRVHRIVARYQGEPAYLLAYRVPKDRPTHLELWVLGIDDCGVRFFAEERL